MVNRSTIAVVLVVVTVLAGCSGILGDEGPGSPEEFEYADGYDAEGVTDGNAAAASYRQALTNKSSYTVTYRQNITGGGTNVTYEVTYRVDVEGEQAYHSVEVSSEEYLREDYFSNGTHASREVNDGDEQSASGDGEFPAEQLTGVDVVARLLSNETDYETSVAERDGTHVVVYETEGAENAAEVFAMDPANVSSFRAEFAVDSEGVVRDASYEIVYVGENDTEQTVTLEFEVRDVGSTSVQRPDWVNEA